MSSCRPSSSRDSTDPKKLRCPANGNEYSEVSARTIAHHIHDAWCWQPTTNRYYFCDDPACDVVYFCDDGSTILKSQLRTRIGVKESSNDNLLCHCFGVTRGDFLADPTTKDFVIAQTKGRIVFMRHQQPIGTLLLKGLPQA